jgi:hypothetical protein
LTNKSLAGAGITTVHAGKNPSSNKASSNYTTKISPVLSMCNFNGDRGSSRNGTQFIISVEEKETLGSLSFD